MKTNTFFGFVLATFVALFAVSVVMASLPVSITQVEANDVVLSNSTVLAGTASDTLPVSVQFLANDNLTDAKVKVWIEGYKNDISAETARFNVVNGSVYVKSLSLALPNVNDMDNINEGLRLYVSITTKDDTTEASYNLELQRDSYAYDFLQADAPTSATAGEIIGLDVVLKNSGASNLQDSFVTVSIPELGISKKAYFGDLNPTDCTDTAADCNQADARERRIYLAIPSDTKTGDYTIEVRASNYDATSTVRKSISISGTAANNTANVTNISANNKAGMPTSVIVLTVVLVIVFVVLLVVLIVLLTKKPSEKSEDFGETSYY